MLGHISRGVAYLSFIGTAAISFVSPVPSLVAVGLSNVPPVVAFYLPILWGALLLVGGVVCLAGVLKRSWVGEYIGLPSLIFCMLGLTVVRSVYDVWAGGFLSLALSALLIHRWYQVRQDHKAAKIAATIRGH